MSYYYDKLQINVIDEITENTGRMSHIVRNLCQGYVEVNYPEILSIDNIAGNIEAQCRSLRGNLKQLVDIKLNIISCAKLSIFLKKVLSEDFFKCSGFPFERLNTLRQWGDNIVKHIVKIDELVNRAILSVSEDIFTEKSTDKPTPDIQTYPEDLEEARKDIEKEFDYENSFNEKTVEADKTLNEYRQIQASLGGYVSKLSHSIQDEVSDLIHTPLLNEIANKVIKLAGEVENQGRAIIANSVNQKVNTDQVQNLINNSNNNMNGIRDTIVGKDFPMKRVERVISRANLLQDRVLLAIKKLLQKGYK